LHAVLGVGTLASVSPAKRPDLSWLSTVVPTVQALLDHGAATRGCTATVRGGHLILGRVDELGTDPRFRLTPLGGGTYGLSLYHRKRWDPLPFTGTLEELVETINTDLPDWAADWSLPPP
jgi:hypothetical protein